MTKKRLARSTVTDKQKATPPNVTLKFYKHADGSETPYWEVRKRVTVSDGKKKNFTRNCKAGSMTDYKDKMKEIAAEINRSSPEELEHGDKTFGDLADYFEREHLVPADFSAEGYKTNKGRRKLAGPRFYLTGYSKPLSAGPREPLKGPNLGLRSLIGDKTKLSAITGLQLARIKADLFVKHKVRVEKWVPKDGKKRGEKRVTFRPRSFSDVNYRFKLLRKMFTVCRVDLKWMPKYWNPFEDTTEPLVEKNKEINRNRLMTDTEEAELLKVAVGPREHLKLVIVGLVETCMRSSEFFQLSVGDWREHERKIMVQQATTKTLKQRAVPTNARLRPLIKAWIKDNNLKDDDWLLTRRSVRKADTRKNKPGMTKHVNDCRTAWKTAKRMTGITDLRLKDLRRTGATRLLREENYTMAEISQVLGHSDIQMTMRYIGVDQTTTDRAVEVQDKRNARVQAELARQEEGMMVN